LKAQGGRFDERGREEGENKVPERNTSPRKEIGAPWIQSTGTNGTRTGNTASLEISVAREQHLEEEGTMSGKLVGRYDNVTSGRKWSRTGGQKRQRGGKEVKKP